MEYKFPYIVWASHVLHIHVVRTMYLQNRGAVNEPILTCCLQTKTLFRKLWNFAEYIMLPQRKFNKTFFFTKSEISNSDHGILEILFDLLHAFFKVWQSNLDAHFSIFSCWRRAFTILNIYIYMPEDNTWIGLWIFKSRFRRRRTTETEELP